MKIAVRYYTKTGNTEKLARAIADAVSAEVLDITAPLEEKADILFLGSSYYAFSIDEAIKTFLRTNSRNIGKIVVFGTAAMMGSTKKHVQKTAAPLGLLVANEEFHCRGSFGKANKGRPNEDDVKSAVAFAKSIITEY